jgi:hypothetical protein
LRPRLLGRDYRVRPLAKGYGERKRSREAAKLPLLAGLPGMVKTAEEYEVEAVDGQERWTRQFRQQLAASWLAVLAWRRTATHEQRREFAERWAYLPHTPEYALDLIRSLSKIPKGVELVMES